VARTQPLTFKVPEAVQLFCWDRSTPTPPWPGGPKSGRRRPARDRVPEVTQSASCPVHAPTAASAALRRAQRHASLARSGALARL
jgi:hypothetical protein